MILEEEAEKKLERYIQGTERAFREMEVKPPADVELKKAFEENISLSKQYLEDSKHYMSKGDFITALVCIAYCEGLIDSCRNMGWLKYEWIFK
ncbi:MAG: DUF357 domain-containing protein [Candidatus Verstraetearchaeota archaeon]|nr:DUF357 domain-containing protein [Candidatus Verstraetearchaeota archaeon]